MTKHTSCAACTNVDEATRRAVLHRCYSLLLSLATVKESADRLLASETSHLSADGAAPTDEAKAQRGV